MRNFWKDARFAASVDPKLFFGIWFILAIPAVFLAGYIALYSNPKLHFLLPLYAMVAILFGFGLMALYVFIMWRRVYMPVAIIQEGGRLSWYGWPKRLCWDYPQEYWYTFQSGTQFLAIDRRPIKDKDGKVISTEESPYSPYIWDTSLAIRSDWTYEKMTTWEMAILYGRKGGTIIPIPVGWLVIAILGGLFILFVQISSLQTTV